MSPPAWCSPPHQDPAVASRHENKASATDATTGESMHEQTIESAKRPADRQLPPAAAADLLDHIKTFVSLHHCLIAGTLRPLKTLTLALHVHLLIYDMSVRGSPALR